MLSPYEASRETGPTGLLSRNDMPLMVARTSCGWVSRVVIRWQEWGARRYDGYSLPVGRIGAQVSPAVFLGFVSKLL